MNRRQQFITKEFYEDYSDQLESEELFWKTNKMQADSPEEEMALKSRRIFRTKFQLLLLRYTAGEPLKSLAGMLETVVLHAEACQKTLSVAKGRHDISLLAIDDWLDEYEEFIQIVSLCILLDRVDLLMRFVSLVDTAGYAGTDTLYEDLLCQILPGRDDVDQWYHTEYDSLIKSIYADTKEEASALLSKYCDEWYSAFWNAPWHDSHLMGDDGSYFGYWALEAAAIAYLYEIDDSKIKHIVYPGDLVEYARKSSSQKTLQRPGRVSANEPCPKTGFWFTSAQSDSKRFFSQGEIMPEFKGSPWGSTIWYWSGENK